MISFKSSVDRREEWQDLLASRRRFNQWRDTRSDPRRVQHDHQAHIRARTQEVDGAARHNASVVVHRRGRQENCRKRVWQRLFAPSPMQNISTWRGWKSVNARRAALPLGATGQPEPLQFVVWRQIPLVDLHWTQRASASHLAGDVVFEHGADWEVVSSVVVHTESRLGADQVWTANSGAVFVPVESRHWVAGEP